jgi:hypothetical protein
VTWLSFWTGASLAAAVGAGLAPFAGKAALEAVLAVLFAGCVRRRRLSS